MIGDRDKIVSCHGISKKTTIGAKLSNEILDIMDSKVCHKGSVKENTTIMPILEEDKNTYLSQFVYPITIQGEKEGVIILCQLNNNVPFDECHVLAIKLVSQFLSKQME
jgi:hypothetical protein